jgi:hypothetical protein
MLNPRGSVVGVAVGLLVMVGCATTTTSSPPSPSSSLQGMTGTTQLTAASAAKTAAPASSFRTGGGGRGQQRSCLMESRYSEGEVSKILRLRDNGESLKTVAAEVGGTRQEVKCAERSALSAKRNARFTQKR